MKNLLLYYTWISNPWTCTGWICKSVMWGGAYRKMSMLSFVCATFSSRMDTMLTYPKWFLLEVNTGAYGTLEKCLHQTNGVNLTDKITFMENTLSMITVDMLTTCHLWNGQTLNMSVLRTLKDTTTPKHHSMGTMRHRSIFRVKQPFLLQAFV